MKRTLLEIYCLVVSFFALAMLIMFLGKTLNSLYYYADPLAGFDPIQLEHYESNEKYFSTFMLPEGVDIDSEFATALRQDSFNAEKKLNANRALYDFRYWIIFLLITLPVYLIHWKIARNLHAKNT